MSNPVSQPYQFELESHDRARATQIETAVARVLPRTSRSARQSLALRRAPDSAVGAAEETTPETTRMGQGSQRRGRPDWSRSSPGIRASSSHAKSDAHPTSRFNLTLLIRPPRLWTRVDEVYRHAASSQRWTIRRHPPRRGAFHVHSSHCSSLERRNGDSSDGTLAFAPFKSPEPSASRSVLAGSGGGTRRQSHGLMVHG